MRQEVWSMGCRTTWLLLEGAITERVFSELRFERGAERGQDAARCSNGQPRAGVVVLFGKDGGTFVDLVYEALRGPRHVELGVFELAGELLDQALVEHDDIAAIFRG